MPSRIRKRSTVDVQAIKDICHKVIQSPAGQASTITQQTACHILETVLMDTKNYKGFVFNVDPELARSKTFTPSHPKYFDRTYS